MKQNEERMEQLQWKQTGGHIKEIEGRIIN